MLLTLFALFVMASVMARFALGIARLLVEERGICPWWLDALGWLIVVAFAAHAGIGYGHIIDILITN